LTTKAVLFDMGGTLIKHVHPGEVFQRILTSLSISKSLMEIKTAFQDAEKEAEDINLLSLFGKLQREEYWHQTDALVLKHLGIADYVELAQSVQSKWFDFLDFTLYSEAKDVLMKLQQRGVKLGLISTAYEEEILLALEKAGLEKTTFDIIVGVDTAQCMKPHLDIFRYALCRLNVKAEEAIFVGDSVEADYQGAENAGLHALLIDRESKRKDLKTIDNLKEVLSRIN